MSFRVPLELPPGLNSDDTTFSAEGRWESGSNIRFVKNMPETIGSWQIALAATLTGVCRNTLAWTTITAGLNYAFGTHSALQVFVSGALYTITPAGLSSGNIDSAGSAPGYGTGLYGMGLYSTPVSAYYARTWSLDTWGTYLLAVPRGGPLYVWQNNTAAVATEVTQSPDIITAMLVTAERQVLALGCNEEVSTTYNPLCIRGSNLEDYTNWTTASNNNVFEHILDGGGRIVTGRRIGPYVAVWTDNNLHLGQYLGNPGQTYRFDPVEANCGLIGPNAVHIYKGVAYWVGTDRHFRAWSPGGKPQIIPCSIHQDFIDNLDLAQADKIVVSGMAQLDEIWIHYPDVRDVASGSAENSRWLAVNVAEGAPVWMQGELNRTAFMDAGVVGYPTGVTTGGTVYHHEIGSADVTWSIITADQYIEEADQFYELQNIRPDFEAQDGDVTMSITTRKTPQGSMLQTRDVTLAAGSEKSDFRIRGRIARFEFAGSQFTRFGKPTFQAVNTGQR